MVKLVMSDKMLMECTEYALCFCVRMNEKHYDVLATKEMIRDFWNRNEESLTDKCFLAIMESELEEINEYSDEYYGNEDTIAILDNEVIHSVNLYLYSLFSEMSNFINV